MKLTVTFTRYFLIVLWVYASVSKLITFDEFQVQLAQSPLLSAYAVPVSYLVIIAELSIAVLLCVRRSLLIGLYLSFGLMTAFVVYIHLILNYSDFVPCSCGGILEKMGWKEHFWFNIIVCLLILLAIIFTDTFKKRILILSSVLLVLSAGTVVALFLSSEYIIKKENPFVLRFLPHGVLEDKVLDLGVNSFYFAGAYQNTVYFGNHTAPLRLAIVDSAMEQRQDYTLSIDKTDFPFRSIRLKVLHPYFYLADGYVPVIFRGKLNQWEAKTLSLGQAYFSDFQPLDSIKIAFRGQSAVTKENVLGLLNISAEGEVSLYPELLGKQIDGVFDTDGILNYSLEQQKAVYTYFYRNQYLVTDANLNLLHRGNTIDTTSIAQIKVSKLKNGEHKMSAPPQTINKNVVTHRNLLFNISNSIGKSESKSMWKQAVVVDVYDFVKQAYIGSFYVYHRGEHKLSDMLVTDHYLYGLFDHELVRYRLAGAIRDKYDYQEKAENL
jgi:hypothetical protein